MGRIVAVDYGTKRVGLAVTDPLQMIATGLTTVAAKDAIAFLKDYCGKESVEKFVVGDARHLDNTPAQVAPAINRFVGQLQQHFPGIPVVRVDERFTSTIAAKTLVDSGLKKKDRQNKALLDTISATIILQSFLETHPSNLS